MNNTCKICGNATREFLDQQFNTKYYHCPNCDFISQDELTVLSGKAEKDQYNLHNNSYEDQGYTDMFRNFLNKAVLDFVPEGKKALEFGSGPEPVLSKILRLEFAYEVDSYDYYYAPEKVYEGKKYDLITSTEVIEHLKEPMDYFRLFASLLKVDGVLGLMTVFHPMDDEKFGDWWYRRDPTHISFFTTKTIEYIGKELGLVVLYNDKKRCFSLKLG